MWDVIEVDCENKSWGDVRVESYAAIPSFFVDFEERDMFVEVVGAVEDQLAIVGNGWVDDIAPS